MQTQASEEGCGDEGSSERNEDGNSEGRSNEDSIMGSHCGGLRGKRLIQLHPSAMRYAGSSAESRAATVGSGSGLTTGGLVREIVASGAAEDARNAGQLRADLASFERT